MSGTSYQSFATVRVQCPFYKGETSEDIRCEGVTRGSALIYHFNRAPRKEAYLRSFCHSVHGCENCPIHRMMTSVYLGGAGGV